MLKLKSIIPKLLDIKNDPIKTKAFKAANEAMGELFTAGIIGHTCVRQQYLTAEMVQSLSKTCFSILLPMFLCTSIMKTVQSNGGKLTPKTMAIPLIAIVHCLIMNYLSKYILLPLFQMNSESDEGRSTIVCCAFGNSGVIPLIFAEVLFRSNFEMVQKAFSFVSLYLVGWSPLFWSFGRFSLLGSSSSSSSKNMVNCDNLESSSLKATIIETLDILKKLFPPPVIGVICGLIVSSIPFIQCLLMKGKDDINKPLLGVVYNSLKNLGKAANPLALLVLTSSLALGTTTTITTTADRDSDDDNNNKNQAIRSTNLLRRLSCVSVARFIISPLIMIMILYQIFGKMKGSGDGDGNSDIDTAMIWFILILESCMPPAQNSVLMLQVAEKTKEATKLARFLFSIYASSMVPIMLIVTYLLEKCRLT